MAIVEDIPDPPSSSSKTYQTVIGDDGKEHKIPLTHPSSIRNRKGQGGKGSTKPLIDLGLPEETQAEVLAAIQKSFNESEGQVGAVSPDEDDEEEQEGDYDYEYEYEEEEEDELPDESEEVELSPKGDLGMTRDPKEEFWDEVFDSLILTVPFTFLYLLLDILVHFQYQHRPTIPILASHLSRAVPTLGILVFYTNRHASHPVTVWFLSALSILSGSRLIWLVNKAGWAMTTDQAPPMGTLWILTIVQLPLSRAIMALAGVAGYTYYSGMKIMP